MADTNIVLDYLGVIKAIGAQLQEVLYGLNESTDKEIKDIISNVKKIEVSDEQSFNKKRDDKKIEKSAIYIVVRFSAGSINYGTSVTPISLYCIGTANKVKPAQLLLSVFASAWTTKNVGQELGTDIEIYNAMQVWNSPEIITNFNEVDADFRNLFRLTGNIVMGDNAVRVGKLTYYYDDTDMSNYEEVNIMAFHDGYRASLDSQPFGNTDGFSKSEVNFSTYTFSISTYLLNNHLSADMLAIRGFRKRSGGGSSFSANDKVRIKIEFTNGYDNLNYESNVLDKDYLYFVYKVVDSQINQEIAGIPSLSITFSR